MSMGSGATLKPRSEWDREDLLDYLDGWHEESGLGFRSQRDPCRVVHSKAIGGSFRAAHLQDAGKVDRDVHREATGV